MHALGGHRLLRLQGQRSNRYWGLNSTMCRALEASSGGNRQVMSRSVHTAAADIRRLQMVDLNGMLSATTSAIIGSGGTCTIEGQVEYPAGNIAGVFTFGAGATTKTYADMALCFSDVIATSLIPRGSDYWCRLFRVYSANVLFNSWRNTARGDVLATGMTTPNLVSGGTITASGNFSAPPLLLLGDMTTPAVNLFSDSKGRGFNDTAESASAAGPGLRGEIAKSFDGSIPFFNSSTGGFRANLWGAETVRKALLPYFSHTVLSLGHNDFYVSGDSATVIQGHLETIIADILAANPRAKITVGTQSHKSTDPVNGHYLNDANQVADHVAERLSLNTKIRQHQLAGQNNGHFEIGRFYESADDNGKWASDGVTNNINTPDGIHPTPAWYSRVVSGGGIDWRNKFVM